MNIIKILMYMSFFIEIRSFNQIIHNKINRNLFMKKLNSFTTVYKPKSINQESYVKHLNDNNYKMIISVGPAGTGKTFFACQKAISLIKSGEMNKVIITRPMVTVEEEFGFLPGDINEKMNPWTRPILDIFYEFYSKKDVDLMLNNGKIEICPLAFMRGRTFKNSFIIADEMQNSSPNQMKMLTTRLGENSRLVITGDLKQSDIIKENGLYDLIKRLENDDSEIKLIKLFHFSNNDIERSEIVKKIIEIYEGSEMNDMNKIVNNKMDSLNQRVNNHNSLVPYRPRLQS
jgi:phosphate starvation-inducible PhoH-like protein